MTEKKVRHIVDKTINIGTRYYNVDSFFCIEITTRGVFDEGKLDLIFHSKYGERFSEKVKLESKTIENARKEVEATYFGIIEEIGE